MIKLTAEDYRRMAFLVEDKSYDFSSDFEPTIEYDTDRFNSDLQVHAMSYDHDGETRLFITYAQLTTSIPEGTINNDFDKNRLQYNLVH